MQSNISTNNSDQPWLELKVPYTISELMVAVTAVIGNSLIIITFSKEKKLHRKTKYYIISLAVADLLIGLLGIPFAVLASVGLPKNFNFCLFTISFIIVLCTVSIFCLVAISVDRYWAVLYPINYRNKRGRTTIGIIVLCWLAGAFVGFLPLMGWNKGKMESKCEFVKIMDYNYLVFFNFAIVVVPSILLSALYAHIYKVVLKQLRRKNKPTSASCLNHQLTSKPTPGALIGVFRKREIKTIQNLSGIILFFVICWMPLNMINVVKALCPDCKVSPILIDCCIILSHLNSSFNPFLYAYHLKDFRTALHNLIFRSHDLPPPFPNSTRCDHFHQIQKHNTTPQTMNPSLASSKSSIAKNNFTVTFEKISTTNHLKQEEPNDIIREDKNYLWTLTEMPSTSEEENHSGNKYLGVENSVFLYVDDTDDDDVFVACDHPKLSKRHDVAVPKSPLKFIDAHRRKSHSLYSLQNLHSNSDYKEGRSFSESYTLSKLSCNSKRNQDIGLALSVTNFYKKLENKSDGCVTEDKSYRTLSPKNDLKGFKKIKSIESE